MPSRFDTPVNVQVEGPLGAGRTYLKQALQLMDNVNRRRTISGLNMMKGVLPLSDTAYAFAISAPGVNVVRVFADEDEPTDLEREVIKYPDFLSGVVADGRLTTTPDGKKKVCASFWPTADCARLFKLPQTTQQSAKLAVEPYASFDELKARADAFYQYTQYESLKPSMYSGLMRQVVQLLMGFGFQAKKSVYGQIGNFVDEEDFIPNKASLVSLYESDVKKLGRQIRYDYRYLRTHGITRASDGKLWIVEIGLNRGIVAMPLPLHSQTATLKFRRRLEDLNDTAGLAALDLLGAFPTGESIPSSPDMFDAMVRAGDAIRIATAAEMFEFYRYYGYSSSMGWAFNERGDEAHNTGYRWDEVDHIQWGAHYQIDLSIGALPDPPRPAAATALRNAFAKLNDKPEFRLTFSTNMRKIDRLTHEQATQVGDALRDGARAAYAVLDALVVQPRGVGSGPLRIAGLGRIFWPSKIQPEIKFPEPLLGYLVSHDMRPDERLFSVSVRCDTTMHVFFVGNELKVCKFFSDPRSGTPVRVTGDDQFDIDWNPVGDFQRTTTSAAGTIPAMFYTTDFDDRAESFPVITEERWKRRDHGWLGIFPGGVGLEAPNGVISNAAGPLEPDFPEGGTSENHKLVWNKSKWFAYEAWSDATAGRGVIGAIAVPFFDRCAYYYARMEGHSGITSSYAYTTGTLSSPWIGHAYRQLEITCGIRESGQRILAPETQYHTISDPGIPYQAFQGLADEGDWVPHCESALAVESDSDVFTRLRATWKFVGSTTPARKTLTVFLMSAGYDGPQQTYTETRNGGAASLWESAWFLPSPDRDAGATVQVIALATTAWGAVQSLVADVTLNSSLPPLIIGPLRQPFMNAGVTYIGRVP